MTDATEVFKVGDRVKIIFAGSLYYGEEGIVVDVDKWGRVNVKDGQGRSLGEWGSASSLELIKPIETKPLPVAPAAKELSHTERKQRPVLTGVLDYFPDAIMEVAHCSFVCNEQHNPGQPMHWAKKKSIGRGDEIVRHLMDRSKKRDADGVRVLAKAAWRALELLQRDIEAEREEVVGTFTPPYDGGWIEWKGGPRPVYSGVKVDVKSQDGFEDTGFAGEYTWGHCMGDSNIVAYRITPKEEIGY